MSTPISELNELIREWANASKLDTADPALQFLNVIEVFGKELYPLVLTGEEGNLYQTIVAIGGTHVTLEILALQLGVTPVISWNEAVSVINPIELLNDLVFTIGGIAECVSKGRDASHEIGRAQGLLEQIAEESINTAPEVCIEEAYNETKERKGEIRDGLFVKEEDL